MASAVGCEDEERPRPPLLRINILFNSGVGPGESYIFSNSILVVLKFAGLKKKQRKENNIIYLL